MLQHLRENAQGMVAKVIIGFIIFTFAIFGLESLTGGSAGNSVASVNGQDIGQQELYQAVNMQRQQLMRQMGDQFDPALVNEQALEQSALQALIDQALLLQSADDLGLFYSEAAIDQLILGTEGFQLDGHFDADQFQLVLRGIGLSPIQFREMVRKEMLISQLSAGTAASAFITPAEIARFAALEAQQRDIQVLTLKADEVRASVDVGAEELQAYYDENSANFLALEQVSVEYLLLDKESMLAEIKVDENRLLNAYDDLVADFEAQASVERVAAHILVEITDEQDKAAALEQANALLARINAGESFADLAKEYSADTFSAVNGGDLGVVETGFFGESFDEALAQLEVGAVSQPVVSDYGVQLIKLSSEDAPKAPQLAEVKDQLVHDIKMKIVEPNYVEKAQLLADISFESADLDQPAEELGLGKLETPLFSREGGDDELSSNPSFVAAAFDAEVLEDGANSQLIELDTERSIVLRVKQHVKPEPKPFAEVKDSIKELLLLAKVDDLLQQRLDELKLVVEEKGLDALPEGLAWEEHKSVNRRAQAGLSEQILVEAFRAVRPDGQPSITTADLPEGDKALLVVTSVLESDVSLEVERADFMRTLLSRETAESTFKSYSLALQEQADINKR